MRSIPADFTWQRPQIAFLRDHPGWTSMNYAFFPLYPLAIRAVMAPFVFFGMKATAAGSLAGVIVSMLGSLAAMLALYRMGKSLFDNDTGSRSAFYLLIFPASMFLSVVYTEGLFLGLSFSALAFARERKFLPAGILAFAATLTRASGALLLLPLCLYRLEASDFRRLGFRMGRRQYLNLLMVLMPLFAYAVFVLTLSRPFHFIETNYFSRNLLSLGATVQAWGQAFYLMGRNPQTFWYYCIELGALVLAIVSLFWMVRYDRVLALYGLVSLGFSFTSGAAQGIHRYVLALPSLFLFPAFLGRKKAFDRAWILLNLPLLVVLLTSFVFNQWAG